MYKSTIKNQQYAVSHISLADLEQGTPAISREQERQFLVDQYNLINRRVQDMAKSTERKSLCLKLAEIAAQLRDIPKAERAGRIEERFFVDAAKEILTTAMFKIVMKEAQKRQEASRG